MKELVPLGDQAALAYFDGAADALRFARRVRTLPPEGLVDIVSAYASVAVFFNLDQTRFARIADQLRRLDAEAEDEQPHAGQLHHIPCCYELQLDLERVAKITGLDAETIIARHTDSEYTIYAIGFCPGFPFLGYLPEGLAGVPRLESPRRRVEAGSVGLAGRQTGVYTLERPGGWNLIGRTPLQLVDVADGYFPLTAGDRVRFRRIDEKEYNQLKGERL